MNNIRKVIKIITGSIFIIFTLLSCQLATADNNKFSTLEIEQFVNQAKDYAIAHGKIQALKDFMDPNNSQFRKGALYIFAQDYNGNNLAHIKAAIVGTNMIGLKDSNGVEFIKEMTKVAKEKYKGWTEYLWQNPETKKVEKKYTYVMKIDDNWWIAAGVYESQKK